MKRGINSKITPAMIALVFEGALAKKFPRPALARKICEMRAEGADFPTIGKKYGLNPTTTRQIVVRAITLYRLNEIQEATP